MKIKGKAKRSFLFILMIVGAVCVFAGIYLFPEYQQKGKFDTFLHIIWIIWMTVLTLYFGWMFRKEKQKIKTEISNND